METNEGYYFTLKIKAFEPGREKSRSDLDCVRDHARHCEGRRDKRQSPSLFKFGLLGRKAGERWLCYKKGGNVLSKEGMNCSWRGWRGIGGEGGRPCSWDGPTGWRNKWNTINRGTEVGNRGDWWWHCPHMAPAEGVGWWGGEALLEQICEEGKGR